jgi:hypothetical protein
MLEPDAEQSITRLTAALNENEHLAPDQVIVGSRRGRMRVQRSSLKSFIQNPQLNPSAFAGWFLTHLTLKLDGPSRVGLVSPQAAGDLQKPSHSTLQTLFLDNKRRAIVRKIVEEAFGVYFVIDPTNLGQLRIRLSNRPPMSEIEEKGIHEEALQFHAAAAPIENASDGVKAFTGIIPKITQSALATTRSAIKGAMDMSGKDMKRDGGIDILGATQEREACKGLLRQLAEYGLFVVEGGELESWLKSLGVSGHGPHWLINIFEKMGEDPDATDYVKPTENDVWKFLGDVKSWLTDPLRLGIPS